MTPASRSRHQPPSRNCSDTSAPSTTTAGSSLTLQPSSACSTRLSAGNQKPCSGQTLARTPSRNPRTLSRTPPCPIGSHHRDIHHRHRRRTGAKCQGAMAASWILLHPHAWQTDGVCSIRLRATCRPSQHPSFPSLTGGSSIHPLLGPKQPRPCPPQEI